MKKIALKTTLVKEAEGEEKNFDYRSQLIAIMKTPFDPRGVDIEEIRRCIRVIDALEAIPEDALFVELEDADFDHLKARVMGTKYVKIDRAVLDFIDTVTVSVEEESKDG